MTWVVTMAAAAGVELFTNEFFRRLISCWTVLRIPELRVDRVGPGQELVVASTLGNPALAENEDLVAVDDRGEAMRDQDGRAAGGGLVQRLHDAALGQGVEWRRRLVKNLKEKFSPTFKKIVDGLD